MNTTNNIRTSDNSNQTLATASQTERNTWKLAYYRELLPRVVDNLQWLRNSIVDRFSISNLRARYEDVSVLRDESKILNELLQGKMEAKKQKLNACLTINYKIQKLMERMVEILDLLESQPEANGQLNK